MYTRSVGVQRPPLLTCFKKVALVTAYVLHGLISVSVLDVREGGYIIRGDIEVFVVLALEVFADAAGNEASDIKDYILVSRICTLNRILMTVDVRQQLHHFGFQDWERKLDNWESTGVHRARSLQVLAARLGRVVFL